MHTAPYGQRENLRLREPGALRCVHTRECQALASVLLSDLVSVGQNFLHERHRKYQLLILLEILFLVIVEAFPRFADGHSRAIPCMEYCRSFIDVILRPERPGIIILPRFLISNLDPTKLTNNCRLTPVSICKQP